jgi:hypothetical protein
MGQIVENLAERLFTPMCSDECESRGISKYAIAVER